MLRQLRPGTARSRVAARLGLGALALLAALWAVGAVVDLLRMRAELDAGKAALSDLSLEHMEGGLVDTVGTAARRLRHADDIADGSPFLGLLGLVPGISGQVEAVRDLTDTAARLGAEGAASATAIDADLQRAGGDPSARVDLLDTVLEELDRLEGVISDLDVGADGALLGPLRTARADLVAELEEAPARLDEARQRVAALRGLLVGPSRYLVLAANNAEMRGGAGMPLSAGVVTIQDGDITFGEFESIANRWAGPIDRSLVPPEYAETYHQFRVGESWLQTAVSPNFTTTGPIYAAMSEQFTFGPVDGVLEVDAVMLRHLLGVIGPVEVDGVSYTEANVEQQILNENYLRYDTASVAEERREAQGEIASAIFEAIKGRDVDVADLALALQSAADGRHLLAYAEDPEIQRLWTELGATGGLPPFGLMVTVQNIAADKLDWYIDPRVTITAYRGLTTGAWRIRLGVTVPNPTRAVSSPAIESFKEGYLDGIHRALVGVYLPEAAYDIRSLDLDYSEAGLDPPLQMVGKRIFIEEGDQESVAIEFSLPPDHPGALILPSGRVRPVTYEVNGVAVTDAVPTAVLWEAPVGSPAGRPVAPTVVAGLALAGAAALLVAARRRLSAASLSGLGDGAPLRP